MANAFFFESRANLEELADALAPLLAKRLDQDVAEPEPEPAEDDPWAEPESRQESRPPARRGSGSGGQSKRQEANGGPPVSGTFTDDRGKKWTFGKRGAPDCDHGEPAAFVVGTGSNGKTYKAWACPKGYGDTWRDKCDLFDFTR